MLFRCCTKIFPPVKLMIYMQFIPFSPETFFFPLRVGGGGVRAVCDQFRICWFKSRATPVFPSILHQIYVPSFIFSFNFYIIKNTPIKIKNTSSCQISYLFIVFVSCGKRLSNLYMYMKQLFRCFIPFPFVSQSTLLF